MKWPLLDHDARFLEGAEEFAQRVYEEGLRKCLEADPELHMATSVPLARQLG